MPDQIHRHLSKCMREIYADTPFDEGELHELVTGTILNAKCKAFSIGGTGIGKTHLCIGVVASVTWARAWDRLFNLIDLVNQLKQEKSKCRSGRLARNSCVTTPLSSTSLDTRGFRRIASERTHCSIVRDCF